MPKNFDLFLKNLTKTNISSDYFAKAQTNTSKIAIKLNQLNYLLGKENLLAAINGLFNENPQAFDVLNFLIAVRSNQTLVLAQVP